MLTPDNLGPLQDVNQSSAFFDGLVSMTAYYGLRSFQIGPLYVPIPVLTLTTHSTAWTAIAMSRCVDLRFSCAASAPQVPSVSPLEHQRDI